MKKLILLSIILIVGCVYGDNKNTAIENQCFVVAANQGGIHDAKRQTSGGSVLIDSWGQVLAEAGLGACTVIANYDAEEQLALRKRMPVAQHRRL